MRRINFFIAIGAFSFLMLCAPGIASAQYGQYDPYGRNGGYGNGGYNNGQYGDMRSIVRDLKSKAGMFQSQLDRDLDHSRINGTRREDEINQLAKDFKSAVNRLNSNGYSNGNSNELNRVFDLGYQLDRTMGRGQIGYNAQNLWSGIRYDLDALRNSNGYYDQNQNRNQNRNRHRNRNGNGGYGYPQNNRPSWWPF